MKKFFRYLFRLTPKSEFTEKQHRVYYQDILYMIVDILERNTPNQDIMPDVFIGTVDCPGQNVTTRLENILAYRNRSDSDLRRKLNERQARVERLERVNNDIELQLNKRAEEIRRRGRENNELKSRIASIEQESKDAFELIRLLRKLSENAGTH